MPVIVYIKETIKITFNYLMTNFMTYILLKKVNYSIIVGTINSCVKSKTNIHTNNYN